MASCKRCGGVKDSADCFPECMKCYDFLMACGECGGVKDSAECFPDCNTCYNKKKAEQRAKYVNRKCDRCAMFTNNGRHWCINCFNEWDRNGGSFTKKSNVCLIEDD